MNETPPLETWQIIDLLSHLVDKSLVVYEEDKEGLGRYRLLETVRQYGADRLRESGERDALLRRHCGRFLEWAEAADERLAGPEQAAALDDLEAEHDNLRSALDGCCCRGGDTETGLRLAANLSEFWATRGHLSEGQQWLALALAQCQDAGSEPGERSPTTKREWTARARALHGAGRLAWHRGEYSVARQHFEEGLQLCRTQEDRQRITYLLMWLGNVAYHQADYEAARSLHGEALDLARERGDPQGVGYALMWLGNTACRRGEYAPAAALYQESLATGREIGDLQSVAYCLGNLGRLSCIQGDFEAARAPLRESLQIRHSLGDRPGIVISLENFANLAAGQKRARRAARLMGATGALREALGIPVPPIGRDEHNGYVARVRAALEEETFTAAWASGRALSRDQAVAYALSEEEENEENPDQ